MFTTNQMSLWQTLQVWIVSYNRKHAVNLESTHSLFYTHSRVLSHPEYLPFKIYNLQSLSPLLMETV